MATRISYKRDNNGFDDWCSWQHERQTRAIRCTCPRCQARLGAFPLGKPSDPTHAQAMATIKAERWRKRKRNQWYVAMRKAKAQAETC